ncbi:MAG: response regulator [Candidatus Marinimicrobia bacterium]|nr:response regulator [Candidatus Neomarinimicrobiota bacterium]
MTAETILLFNPSEESSRDLLGDSVPVLENHSVKEIHNVRDLFEQLRHNNIALILWDMDRPDDSNIEVIRRIQREYNVEATPLIVMQPEMDESIDGASLYREGVDLVLNKPVKHETLSAVLDSRLSRAKKLKEISRYDLTTALPNRTAFEDAIYRDTALANREQLPLSLGLLRIHNYQDLRLELDTLTFQAVQKKVANQLQSTFRKSDTVAKWDERTFAVLWPNTHRRGAVLAAQKVISSMDELTEEGANNGLITPEIAAGVVEITRFNSIEEAIDIAERHLFLAEENNAVQVVFSTEDEALAHEKTVFLIMDDNLTTSMASHRIEKAGYHVETFTSGEEALTELEEESVNAIILDSQVADMDGYDLLRRIRSIEDYKQTPIILLSFTSTESEVVRAFDSGADDFISKPFSTTELATRLQRLLRIL